jgi:hypothetical protein
MFRKQVPTVLFILLLSILSTGCCKRIVGKGDPEEVSVGQKVQAPWSAKQNYYPGTVREIYGKLARIDFDDGDKGWVLVSAMDPPGKPKKDPSKSSSKFSDGDKVSCPWSQSGSFYPGKVSEVYGKLVHIDFDDGDKGWALANKCKAKLETTAFSPPVQLKTQEHFTGKPRSLPK